MLPKKSPLFDSKGLTGLALQIKMTGDLMRAHQIFNEGITKLGEYAKEVHAKAREVHAHMERIDTLPPGKKGDKGDTPQIDIDAIKEEILNLIPKPADGESPDIQELADLVLSMIPAPVIPKAPIVDHERLADLMVDKIAKDKKFKIEHVAGLTEEVASYRSQLAGKVYGRDTWARGGGDTVAAGTNITFTKDSNGNKVINASGGGSSGYQVPTSGLIDGSNRTFGWATAPNVIVLDNGNAMNKESADGTVNWTGTTTTVLTQAPNFNIYATA